MDKHNTDPRIHEKLDELLEHIIELKTASATQQATLADRGRRIEQLEEGMIQVKDHVVQVRGAAKLAGGVAVFLGALAAIAKTLGLSN